MVSLMENFTHREVSFLRRSQGRSQRKSLYCLTPAAFPWSTWLLCLNKTCKNRKSSFLGLKRACEGFLYKENSGMCFSVWIFWNLFGSLHFLLFYLFSVMVPIISFNKIFWTHTMSQVLCSTLRMQKQSQRYFPSLGVHHLIKINIK